LEHKTGDAKGKSDLRETRQAQSEEEAPETVCGKRAPEVEINNQV
jgi:hypothetical protein